MDVIIILYFMHVCTLNFNDSYRKFQLLLLIFPSSKYTHKNVQMKMMWYRYYRDILSIKKLCLSITFNSLPVYHIPSLYAELECFKLYSHIFKLLYVYIHTYIFIWLCYVGMKGVDDVMEYYIPQTYSHIINCLCHLSLMYYVIWDRWL